MLRAAGLHETVLGVQLPRSLLLLLHQDRRIVWSHGLPVLTVSARFRELTLAASTAGIAAVGTLSLTGGSSAAILVVALLPLSVVIGLSTAASP